MIRILQEYLLKKFWKKSGRKGAELDNESFSSSRKPDIFNNNRKTIAFLGGPISSLGNERWFAGAGDAAESNDINLIAFAGGDFYPAEEIGVGRSQLFDLFNPDLFDGVIIQGEEILRNASEDETKKFFSRISPLPIVCMNGRWDDITTIEFEMENCTEKLMDHLIDYHKYEKIALFRGPDNKYAISLRNVDAYKRALKRHGIPVDENLIVINKVAERLEESKLDEFLETHDINYIDVIVAVKARQAYDIISALHSRGIRVPEDIAVVGCTGEDLEYLEDISELTYCRTATYKIGYKAMMTLLEKIDGHNQPGKIYIDSHIHFGNSCGCHRPNYFQKEKLLNYVEGSQKAAIYKSEEVFNELFLIAKKLGL